MVTAVQAVWLINSSMKHLVTPYLIELTNCRRSNVLNLRSSPKVLPITEPGLSKVQAVMIVLRQLPQYLTCAGLGLLGGTGGLTLAIGLTIVVQLLLPPSKIFLPGAIPFIVMAAAIGLGVSWLLSRATYRIFPGLLGDLDEQGLQVTLVFSTFTSLLQTVLFFV